MSVLCLFFYILFDFFLKSIISVYLFKLRYHAEIQTVNWKLLRKIGASYWKWKLFQTAEKEQAFKERFIYLVSILNCAHMLFFIFSVMVVSENAVSLLQLVSIWLWEPALTVGALSHPEWNLLTWLENSNCSEMRRRQMCLGGRNRGNEIGTVCAAGSSIKA